MLRRKRQENASIANDQVRTFIGLILGACFVFATLNAGRGTDRVFQELKDWTQSILGKRSNSRNIDGDINTGTELIVVLIFM